MKLDRRTLPLNAMRAFEAAARHCHLRRASEELGVTHGALSRQVKQLEEQLGVLLFNRAHNRLSLTHAGERLLQSVTPALDMLTAGALFLDPDSMQGDLVIATTPSTASSWVLQTVGAFAQQYPEINIQLCNLSANTRRIDSKVDVAICYGLPAETKLTVEPLMHEEYFPVASPTLLAAGSEVKQAADLLGFTLLCDRHNHWPRWFETAGLAQVDIPKRWHIEEPFLVLDAVKRGYGIGLADRIEVHRELEAGSLVALSNVTVQSGESYYLVYDDSAMSLRAQLFTDYLRQQIDSITRRRLG